MSVFPFRAEAISTEEAVRLVDQLVVEINAVINSGRSESRMIADFEQIFVKYADVPIIARSTLGVDYRRASGAQRSAYTRAFQGYLARKYGKRFREFIGGRIEVQTARPRGQNYEVRTLAKLQGQAPFEVSFFVSDRSGQDLFFDLRIEGISLLNAERTEIGAMLDKRGGNLDQLIADLRSAG